jgi:hypothetical protein
MDAGKPDDNWGVPIGAIGANGQGRWGCGNIRRIQDRRTPMKNLVILIGRIVSAAETRHAGETATTSFTLVTDRLPLIV